MVQHESDTIIFLAETTVRRFLPALFKLLFSFRPACCKLSSGRQPISLCSVYALMSPSLIKGFLYERFRLVSPWCWNMSIVSFCSAFLLKIIVHLFSILHPLSIILIPSSELVAVSYHLFYFAKTSDFSFSSSLLDCSLSSFPKVSRQESSLKLSYCIKPSFPEDHICFFPSWVIQLVL